MERDQIINAIETAGQANGLAPATITSRAVGNSRLYQRLKGGGDCTTLVAKKIIDFIATLGEAKAS